MESIVAFFFFKFELMPCVVVRRCIGMYASHEDIQRGGYVADHGLVGLIQDMGSAPVHGMHDPPK